MTIDITPEAASGYRGSIDQLINALEAMPIRGGINGQVVAAEAAIVIRALSASNEDAYLRGFSAGAKVPNSGAFTVIDSPELASLRDALTASLAETAAAYEVAAQVVDLRASFYAAKRDSDDTEIEMHLVLIEVVEAHGYAASAIRALTPADSKAALERIIADARNEGMRKAAGVADGIGERIVWQSAIARAQIIRDAILTSIPKGGDK